MTPNTNEVEAKIEADRAAKASMTAEQKADKIAELLDNLREAQEKEDRNTQKAIRARLRRLGHSGGLGERRSKGDDDSAPVKEVPPKMKTGNKKAAKKAAKKSKQRAGAENGVSALLAQGS